MKSEKKVVLENIINKAMDKGVDGCDLILADGNSFSVSVQKGDIDKYKVSSSQIMGIRTIKEGRVGISYSEIIDDAAASRMIDQAIENSRFSAVDEYQSITHKRDADYIEKSDKIYREDNTETKEKIDFALHLEKEPRKHSFVKSVPYNGYSDGEAHQYYMNHLGTFCTHQEKSFSAYTSALAEENGRQSLYYHSTIGRNFNDLNADQCIDESLKWAKNLLKARQIPTGYYDVIFTTDCLDELLGCFLSVFSAKAAMEGKTRFVDSVGSEIADSRLSIKDLPQYKDGFYFSGWDDEGVDRKDLTLIENGVLQSLYHNTNTAKYFKTDTTAHAVRSAKSALTVSPTQLVIQPGKVSDKDLTGGEYLEIIKMSGLHSGSNAITGDFSFGIEGVLYRGNEAIEYVKEVTVSGNFFQILNQIADFGDVLHANTGSSFFSPKIRFKGLSVAGK